MQLKLCGKCEIDHDESAALLNPYIYKRIFWNNICRWSWAQRASQPYFKGFETIQNKHLENMFNVSRGGCQTGITSPFRCHSSGWYNTQFVHCDRHCLNLMRQLVCSGGLWLDFQIRSLLRHKRKETDPGWDSEVYDMSLHLEEDVFLQFLKFFYKLMQTIICAVQYYFNNRRQLRERRGKRRHSSMEEEEHRV